MPIRRSTKYADPEPEVGTFDDLAYDGLWVQSAADPTAQAQGSMVVYNGSTQSLATVQWDDTNMILSIYAASAAQQLNVSGQLYGIFVGGAMA